MGLVKTRRLAAIHPPSPSASTFAKVTVDESADKQATTRKIAPQKFQIDGRHKFMLSYSRSPGLNSVATGVRTGAVDEPLG